MLALAGGVGGAKLASGLADVVGAALTVIVNTGDDFDHLGLRICPDLDTVMYTLAGIANPETGWGVAGETWSCLERIAALGGDDWFKLGDRDLATHILRTQRLRGGQRLTEISAAFAQKLAIAPAVLPMSDSPVRTRVKTEAGDLDFQDYFVRRRCDVPLRGFSFDGANAASISPELHARLADASEELVVVCPSNPFVSIDPILSVPTLRERLAAMNRPIIAVSPVIGGKAVKGPAAKMMRELGMPVSPASVARHYRGLVHGMVIDREDETCAPEIEALGMRVKVTATLMTDRATRRNLAEQCILFGRTLAGGRT